MHSSSWVFAELGGLPACSLSSTRFKIQASASQGSSKCFVSVPQQTANHKKTKTKKYTNAAVALKAARGPVELSVFLWLWNRGTSWLSAHIPWSRQDALVKAMNHLDSINKYNNSNSCCCYTNWMKEQRDQTERRWKIIFQGASMSKILVYPSGIFHFEWNERIMIQFKMSSNSSENRAIFKASGVRTNPNVWLNKNVFGARWFFDDNCRCSRARLTRRPGTRFVPLRRLGCYINLFLSGRYRWRWTNSDYKVEVLHVRGVSRKNDWISPCTWLQGTASGWCRANLVYIVPTNLPLHHEEGILRCLSWSMELHHTFTICYQSQIHATRCIQCGRSACVV